MNKGRSFLLLGDVRRDFATKTAQINGYITQSSEIMRFRCLNCFCRHIKKDEGSPGRQLDLETYLADVWIGGLEHPRAHKNS